MVEKFELKGRWRLPDNENWLNGTLYFDPEERTRLELFGSFNTTFNTAKVDVILGETNKGDVTLIDNMFGGRTSHQNGVIIGKYNPKLVFQGFHFNTEDDIRFSKIKFQAFNLFQWFNLTGLNTDWCKKGNDISICYSEIEEIKFKVNESCEGMISFFSPISAEGTYNRIEMEERCLVTFQYSDSKPYNDILIDMSYFIDFITLCTFEQSYPMSIQFQDERYKETFNGKEIKKTIRLDYEHNRYNPNHRIRRRHEHLIAYQDIKDDFSKVILNWHQYHERFDTVFNLMLSTFRQKTKFSEYDFLDNIRAIESYHKQIYNKEKMRDYEHESMVKRILGSCKLADLDFEWLRRKLTKQFDPNLRERVTFLVHEYTNSYIENKFKDEQIYDDIINSRNYYAHYDQDKKSKALKGIPLFNLTQKLMGLIYSCILTDVGVEKAHFEKSLNDLLWE